MEVSISVSGMKLGQKYLRKLFWQGGYLRLCRVPSKISRPPPDLLIRAAVSRLCLSCYKKNVSLLSFTSTKMYQFNV